METKSYFEALSATINSSEIATKNGLSYIAAATAMRLAGRPEATFVDFDGMPYLEMLNGSVVAVDLKIPGTQEVQRMYLPVMDRDNTTLPFGKTVLTDINNSRQRCLVKAIAAVYGDGMSIFMGCDGDGEKAVKMLGVNPDSDLESVTPIIATLKDGGAPYIEWATGLAACRITDPTFRWEVVMWDGKPYRKVLGGLMVDVDTVYEGLTQRLSLPIMDAAHEPMAAEKVTVFDWNKTVMRALTKCIAFNSGYGLGVYADEFGSEDSDAKKARKSSTVKEPTKAKAEAAATTPVAAQSKASTTASPAPAAVAETSPAVAEPQGTAAPAEVSAPATTEKAEVAPAPTETAPAATEKAVPVAEVAPAAEPAPAAAAEQAAAPVADEADAVTRFREVLRKRKDTNGIAGILSLFEALSTSTKFAAEDKPACFAVLVMAAASQIDSISVTELLGNLVIHKAMQYVSADSRDMVGAKVTAVTLTTALEQGDEALQNAHLDLISSGIAVDTADVLRLAALGHVPQETIDLVRDVVELANA